jgi:hypothetical protein
MESLPQALGFIFEMQRKRCNEKKTRKKKTFQILFFKFIFPLWTLVLSNQLKML